MVHDVVENKTRSPKRWAIPDAQKLCFRSITCAAPFLVILVSEVEWVEYVISHRKVKSRLGGRRQPRATCSPNRQSYGMDLGDELVY